MAGHCSFYPGQLRQEAPNVSNSCPEVFPEGTDPSRRGTGVVVSAAWRCCTTIAVGAQPCRTVEVFVRRDDAASSDCLRW